jgi:predicted ATPase
MNITYQPYKKIKFLKDYRCFKKNDVFEFKPGINLLVGDQGCGKSTLMQCMMNNKSEDWKCETDKVQYFSFDTEKDNPRMIHDLNDIGMDLGYALTTKFLSHGESNLPKLKMMKKASENLFFVDEPESALSIRSQLAIAKILKSVGKNNQFIISTHSEIIINIVDEVLNLEKKIWMPTKDFLDEQYGRK